MITWPWNEFPETHGSLSTIEQFWDPSKESTRVELDLQPLKEPLDPGLVLALMLNEISVVEKNQQPTVDYASWTACFGSPYRGLHFYYCPSRTEFGEKRHPDVSDVPFIQAVYWEWDDV